MDTLEVLPYDWMKKHGVDFKDINVRYMGNTPEAVEAFKAGALDLICTIEPYGTALLNDVKGAVMLSDGIDIYGPGYTDCVLAVRADLIKQNPGRAEGADQGDDEGAVHGRDEAGRDAEDLVGPYYKTSMENAQIAMASSPPWWMRAARRSSSSTASTASWRWATSRRSPAATRSTGRCWSRSSRRTGPLWQAQVQVGCLIAVVAPPPSPSGPPPGHPARRRCARLARGAARRLVLSGGALSIGLFAGIWELCWAIGWADPKLLPPPHVFIGNIVDQAKFFNTVNRWQIGVDGRGPRPCNRC